MSPYGQIGSTRRATPLSPLLLPIHSLGQPTPILLSVHHLTLHTAPADLVSLMWRDFSDELDKGLTYPQEGPLTREAFEAYFFAADVFVGLSINTDAPYTTLEEARGDRAWSDCVSGFYYVKPNYPGRSSHICNAGFVVRPVSRGQGIGRLLGTSYLHFAPQLGYKASVFNLVYANNTASLAIWDKLGFKRVGLIPGAGRLKRPDSEGGGEHYVDAVVIWKSFEGV